MVIINGKHYKQLHTSYARGYVKVNDTNNYVEYKGIFGKGLKHYQNNPKSTRYCLVTYYIEM